MILGASKWETRNINMECTRQSTWAYRSPTVSVSVSDVHIGVMHWRYKGTMLLLYVSSQNISHWEFNIQVSLNLIIYSILHN